MSEFCQNVTVPAPRRSQHTQHLPDAAVVRPLMKNTSKNRSFDFTVWSARV